MTTKTYMISTEAGWAGAYEGADEAEALDAYARDAGHEDYATACREVPLGSAVAYPCEAAVRLARDTVVLLHDRDAFRWYTIHGEDIEVSGSTVADAARDLLEAYPYSDQWTDEGTAVVKALLAREVQATVGGTVTVTEVAACGYREARLGHLSGPCPACGVVGSQHVRECERCGTDIAADDAADLVDADGHLYCDDCEVQP